MNSPIRRIPKEFIEEMDVISTTRVRVGIDQKTRPIPEIMKKIPKTENWFKVRDELIRKEFLKEPRASRLPNIVKNKRGSLTDIFSISLGVAVLAIVGLCFLIIAGIILYSSSIINENLNSIPTENNMTNVSDAARQTFGQFNLGLQQLRWISFVVIFGMLLAITATGLYVKSHPFFFPLYLLVCAGMVLFSIYISRAYETLYLSRGMLGTTLQSFGASSWMLIHLPTIVAAVSLLTGIFVFVSLNNEGGEI